MNTEKQEQREGSERDLPLIFQFEIKNEELIEQNLRRYGLPNARNKRYAKARLSILAEAVRATMAGKWVSYSRSKNYYSKLGRYFGTGYSYRVVTAVADELRHYGLTEEVRARRGAHRFHNARQSKLRATDKAVIAYKDAVYEYRDLELVRLRDRNRRIEDYLETTETEVIRSQLIGFNEFLASIDVQVTANDLRREHGYIVIDEDCYILESVPRLHRVFNRSSFELGERFYGWWQSLPERHRASILLNGRRTVELDFSQYHPTMLYAEMGILMARDDAYAISGYPRHEGKLAFNIGINAPTTKKAIGAIQHELNTSKDGPRRNRTYAAALLRAIKAAHPDITNKFGSDYGVHLMYVDSLIMAEIMTKLISMNIPFLPVHDSVIVPEDEEKIAREVMKAAFANQFKGTRILVKKKR